jgi:hypothetical protein
MAGISEMGSKDVTSRSAVVRAIKECDALGRDRFLDRYGFRRAFKYRLRFGDGEYDSKAILGVAHGYQFPKEGPLTYGSFSGGKDDAAKYLHQLGFEIDGMQRRPDEWSIDEVELLVSDYFAMLAAELSGDQVNKSQHRRMLKARGVNRSDGSIERKHQNVSSVFSDFGLPFIQGYKPLSNRQTLLESVVIDQLDNRPDLFDPPSENFREPSTIQVPEIEDAPSFDRANAVARKRQAVRIDYAAREAAQRKLGEAGEKWVFEFEQRRLGEMGRDDLANEVTWVSKDIGDGLGYDIRSFDERGSELFIEVKTTRRGVNEPFMLTPNELAKSKEVRTQYAIYRVFEFGAEPRVYVLSGAVDELCNLQATGWRAFPK